MKPVALIGTLLAVSTIAIFMSLPKSTPLQGNATASPDGKTYLIVAATDKLHCKIDQKEWPYRPGEKAPITPGTHSVECSGDEAQFAIPAGSTFYLD